MTQTIRLYLDDLAVGDTFRSGEHRLDEQQTIGFAREFDPQPFHLDAAAAEHSFFRGLAASGWHTAAVTMKLLVASVPFGSGIIGAGGTIEWPRPTRPGDTLHVVSKITAITPSRSKPDRGLVTLDSETRNQRDEVCQHVVMRILVMRKPE